MVQAKSQALEGTTEAAASELEASKEGARSMLEAGSSVEEIAASTGLGRNQILGIKGSMAKAQKRLGSIEDKAAKGSPPENPLVNDLRDEAKLDGAALIAARNQNRLRTTSPKLYADLHGGQESEANSPGKILADLELAKYIKQMREQETTGHQNNNGGDSQAISELKKQVDDLKEERHKKDLEDLKGQITELREDMRHSTNSASDLAVVIRESSQLLSQVITHPGPIRNYLAPDIVRDKKEAPFLAQPAEARNKIIDTLRMHGLTTRVER